MVDALDHILLTGRSIEDANVITKIVLSRKFWVVGVLASVLPFSFYQTLDELKRTSTLALVFVFMLVGMIVMYSSCNLIFHPQLASTANLKKRMFVFRIPN